MKLRARLDKTRDAELLCELIGLPPSGGGCGRRRTGDLTQRSASASLKPLALTAADAERDLALSVDRLGQMSTAFHNASAMSSIRHR